MFKCQSCNKISTPGEKQHKKTVETRQREYAGGSTGTEIVKEIVVCGSCK